MMGGKGASAGIKSDWIKVAKLPMCDQTCEELPFHIWRLVINDTYGPKIEPI